MALTETWLYNHKDAELHIEGYKLFRGDRKRAKRSVGRFSGGVGCYVRLDIASTLEIMVNFSNGVVELLTLYSRVNNLYIAIIYRQPDDRMGNHRSTEKEFQEAIDKLNSSLSNLPSPCPNIVFCGDFNIPHSCWPSCTPAAGAFTQEKAILESLSVLRNDHFLNQHIEKSTHTAGGVLDLLFCNNDSIVHSYELIEPLRSTSDHFVVEVIAHLFSFTFDEEEKPDRASPLDNLNFHSNDINWKAMSSELQSRLANENLEELPPNERLDALMKVLIEVAYKFVPAKKSSRRGNHSKIPRDRRILMKKRRKLIGRMENISSIKQKKKVRKRQI